MLFNVGEKTFEVDDGLLSRYKDSMLAKCVEHAFNKGEEILVDRDPRYFEMVLKFLQNPNSLPLHRMSNIELGVLMEEADFYAIDNLIKKCKTEIECVTYKTIDTISDKKDLETILANETRYVILLQEQKFLCTEEGQEQLRAILPLVNRDKCLLLGFSSAFRDHYKIAFSREEEEYGMNFGQVYGTKLALLYDPRKDKVLMATENASEISACLAASVFIAHTGIPNVIEFICSEWDELPEERFANFIVKPIE
uniref:BTB domain-containing protein n=1 Tax=Aceria tosichella TaxID=561515 RepID=A0A6G1SQZ0_9ACAR